LLSLVLLSYDPDLPDAKRREAVARGLASLVPSVIEGLVADAALVGPAGSGLDAIADEAGCLLIEAASAREGLDRALARIRCAELFLLDSGYAVEAGFPDAARDVLAFGGLERARVLRAAPDGLLSRLAPRFAPPAGILARKPAVVRARAATLRGLARELRAAEIASVARACI